MCHGLGFWFGYHMFPVLFCSYILMCLVVTSCPFFPAPFFVCTHVTFVDYSCVFQPVFSPHSLSVPLQLLGFLCQFLFPLFPWVTSVSLLCSLRLLVYLLLCKPLCIPLLASLLSLTFLDFGHRLIKAHFLFAARERVTGISSRTDQKQEETKDKIQLCPPSDPPSLRSVNRLMT